MCVCISLHALVSMLYLLATMKIVSHRKATLMWIRAEPLQEIVFPHLYLTHFMSLVYFYRPLKTSEILCFSDVFMEYRKRR